MAGMVSVAQLRDYLGVDADSDDTISRLRASALGSLRVSTGIDWEAADTDKRQSIACEAVQTMVWLSFYAARGDATNADFLRQYLTGLIVQLQYGEGGGDGTEH